MSCCSTSSLPGWCISFLLIICDPLFYLFFLFDPVNRSIFMQKHKSKDELLYQNAINGDVEGVKALARQGAGLEWKDEEGRTPLIVASINPRLDHVTKTLAEMGSNVNAHCSRSSATPSHHAAKRGSHQTVALLLSHGANAFAKDNNHKKSLDVARTMGTTLSSEQLRCTFVISLVRAIEVQDFLKPYHHE